METTTIIKSEKNPRNRLLVITPTLGIIRSEWAAARYGQMIPPNWSLAVAPITACIPMNYLVAHAQNIGVHMMIEGDFEWLLFHEDDVILPLDAFSKFNIYMREAKHPVISGLYYLKSDFCEPILYRGRGNSCFDDFKVGEKVWVDGVPTGCLLIHRSVLKLMYDESEWYDAIGNKVKKVFETPSAVWYDAENRRIQYAGGTSDLTWCSRVMKDNILERAGWEVKDKKNPFLCDTSIFCMHIDLATGIQYPIRQN